MTRLLSHWLSPMQADAPQTVLEAVERVRRHTPEGWTPRILVPAVYGSDWQAVLRNSCGMELRPIDAPDLQWVQDRFAECDLLMGAWGVPRELTFEEGVQHGAAANVVSDYVLDLEPCEGFLIPPYNRSPEEFIAGFTSACDTPPHVSVVPVPWGIDSLGAAWGHWAQWARTIRPQVYWSDASVLDPSVSLPYLVGKLKQVRLTRTIIPIYPANGGDRLHQLLSRSRASRDIWVLAS